jgi:uncharacterized protein YukE
MAIPNNAPTGPKNQRPQQHRYEQSEDYHRAGTDEKAFNQNLNTQRLLQQERRAAMADQLYHNQAYNPAQNRTALQPQISNSGCQFAASNNSTTMIHPGWKSPEAPEFARSVTPMAPPQQATKFAGPSPLSKSLDPSTPSWSPEKKTVSVQQRQSQNAQAPVSSTGKYLDVHFVTGVTQARRASDESKGITGLSTAHAGEKTTSVPAPLHNLWVSRESVDRAMARIMSQNKSASVEQSNDDTSDSDETVRAGASQSRSELEAEIQKLKKENAELRTANEELGAANEKLEEENDQWVNQYKEVSDKLEEVKNQLHSSTETPSNTDLGSAVPGGEQATSSSPPPTHTPDGRRITSRLRQFMSEGKGKRL